MRCENVQPWLGAWQDGEINPWHRWQIMRHVRNCANCRAEMAALAQLTAHLKSADPIRDCGRPRIVPAPARFGIVRSGAVAAALLVFALTGLYALHNPAVSTSVPGGNPVAVGPQEVPIETPLVPIVVSEDKPAVHMARRNPMQQKSVRLFKRQQRRLASTTYSRARRRRLRRPRRMPGAAWYEKFAVPVIVEAVPRLPKPTAQPEIIQISVKVCDSHDIARQIEKDKATIEAADARQEIIAVSAVPDPFALIYPEIPGLRAAAQSEGLRKERSETTHENQ